MKNVGITTPCSENFNAMQPNEHGAYCNQCEKNVIDFTNKSNEEIKRTLLQHAGKDLCARMTLNQEETLNAEFEAWSFRSTKSFQSAFVFTLIAVFGLGLFSCSEQKHEQEIIHFQQTVKSIAENIDTDTKMNSGETIQFVQNSVKDNIEYDVPNPLLEELMQIEPMSFTDDTLELVKIIGDKYQVAYAGGAGYTMTYFKFLEQTVPDEYDTEGQIIPKEFSSLAFPNPTIDNSTLEIKVPVSGEFQLDLYDMNGKHQQEIFAGSIDRGTFRKEIELRDLPSGMYLVTIFSKDYKETIRISKL